MTATQRIAARIERTTDKKLLRLLNRAWWRAWFRQMNQERKAA
jgi:hypothetical protein